MTVKDIKKALIEQKSIGQMAIYIIRHKWILLIILII